MSKKNEIIVSIELETAKKKELISIESKIEKAFESNEKAQFTVASCLAKVYGQKLFVETHKNISEYAFDRFGIAKSTTSEAINTFKAFGDVETGKINEIYSAYSYGQLNRMRKLDDAHLLLVSPETSLRELEAMLKEQKEQLSIGSGDIDEPEEVFEMVYERESEFATGSDGNPITVPANQINTNLETLKSMPAGELKKAIIEMFERHGVVLITTID